jgi:protein-disulfide isomerase
MADDGPEDGAGEDAGPDGAPAAAAVARPTWTYFLVPAAVLLGALAIAAAIAWTWRDDGDGEPRAAGGDTESTVPEAQSTGSLLTTLVGYANALGLDEAAFRQCLGAEPSAELINEQLQRGFASGVNGTPTFFINDKVLIGAQPAAILDEIIDHELAGTADAVEDYSPAVQQLAAAGRFRIADGRIAIDGAEIKGDPDARVVVVEFSDFQCPFCKRWVEQSYGALSERLGEDVALAFLHFPIVQIHPNAGNASVAAVCAGAQGKFWEMHDTLFARQEEWKGLR